MTTAATDDDLQILLVSPSRDVREQALRALAGLAAIQVHAEPEPALASLDSRPVQLLIWDLTWSELLQGHGFEQLRRERRFADCLLLAGPDQRSAAVAALQRGVADFLLHPIESDQLRARVGALLEQRRLAALARDLRARLHTIDECRVLGPCLDPGKVYPLSLDLLLQTLSRGRGLAVFRRTSVPDGQAVAFRGISNGEAERLRTVLTGEKQLPIGGYESPRIVEHGEIHEALARANVQSGRLLALSLQGEESEAGLLCVFEDDRAFEPGELARVDIVTSYATEALRNAERYQNAKERASIDDVTEVFNARHLLTTATNEIQRAERYGVPLSVLFLDLDRFKLVNDRYGHLVGSQCLRSVSQLLLRCVRQVDTLARYGGDEFTILLVDTDHEAALIIAERIRRAVEDEFFEGRGAGLLRLTISIGVGTYPEHGDTRDTLLDVADKAMYRAKSLGRNRVCSAADLSS
jgi:diguanylate cyclase (GGDEF)-like protein